MRLVARVTARVTPNDATCRQAGSAQPAGRARRRWSAPEMGMTAATRIAENLPPEIVARRQGHAGDRSVVGR